MLRELDEARRWVELRLVSFTWMDRLKVPGVKMGRGSRNIV